MIELRIVATVLVYNEADIIGQVLDHLHENGVSSVILDGGSQDGSIEIALGYEGRGLLEHKIVKRDNKRLDLDLDCLNEMAAKHNPDWILRNDADEFLESPNAGETLHDAIANEERLGFNVVQFNNFEFCLTEQDYHKSEADIRKKLNFYTWSDDYRYKAWKYYLGATDRVSGGHFPSYPRGIKIRVSPRQFVMRHYRFRTPEQAVRRVFKERLPRYAPEIRAMGWCFHYDDFKEDPQFFILESKLLSKYEEDGEWNLTLRFDWYANLARRFDWYPTREELFGSPFLGLLTRMKRKARRRLSRFGVGAVPSV